MKKYTLFLFLLSALTGTAVIKTEELSNREIPSALSPEAEAQKRYHELINNGWFNPSKNHYLPGTDSLIVQKTVYETLEQSNPFIYDSMDLDSLVQLHAVGAWYVDYACGRWQRQFKNKACQKAIRDLHLIASYLNAKR